MEELVAIIERALRGHKQSDPAPQTATVQPALPIAQPEPVLPAIKLSADAAAGKVSIDDQSPADLQDAQWGLDKIAAGDHTIKFENPTGSFEATISSAAAKIFRTHKIIPRSDTHKQQRRKNIALALLLVGLIALLFAITLSRMSR